MSYRDEYRGYERDAKWTFWRVVFFVIFASIVLGTAGWGLGWCSEAGQVAREQFGPRGALKKYEWFKDAAAQLDKKRADIVLYEARVASTEKRAEGGDRTDRERLSIVESELAGLIASYNALAAEYNSASSKFNWKPFEGELPREVVPYNPGR